MVLEDLAIQDRADLHMMGLAVQLIVVLAARVMPAPVAQPMTDLVDLLTVGQAVQCLGYQVVRPIAALVAHATLALVGPAIQDREVMVGAALRFADNGLC